MQTPAEVFASVQPTLLPPYPKRTRDEGKGAIIGGSSASIALDTHSLLHLSSAFPWRNAGRRRETAVQLLAFIRTHKLSHPVTSYVATVVLLQRIWRGVISRRRLLRALRARQQALLNIQQASSSSSEEEKGATNSDAEPLPPDMTVDASSSPSSVSDPPHQASQASMYQAILQRSLPWPSFSDRATRYSNCLGIYNVMRVDEQQRALTKQTTRSNADGAEDEDGGLDEDALLRAMEMESAAKMLQQRVRALLMFREVSVWWVRERWGIFYVAAATIQRAWERYALMKDRRGGGGGLSSSVVASPYLLNLEAQQWRRKMHRRFFLTKADASAAMIQGWWRRLLQKRIFRYFVRVITDSAAIVSANNAAKSNYGRSRPLKPFMGTHKPSASSTVAEDASSSALYHRTAHALLKQINYGEACMLQDPASSGLHVRFRLAHGGIVSFPPVIVYKIAAHTPVVDVGLQAPKDYVLEGKKAAERRNQPIILHNKPETISIQKQKMLANTLGDVLPSGIGSSFKVKTDANRRGNAKQSAVNGTTDFGIQGAATDDYTGTRGTDGANQRGNKGLTAKPLSWASNQGAMPPPNDRHTVDDANLSPSSPLFSPSSRYERSDNNPWRLADTKAMADGTVLEDLLKQYQRSAHRSLMAARAAKMITGGGGAMGGNAQGDAVNSRSPLLPAMTMHGRSGKAAVISSLLTAKHLVSASRNQAATGALKKAAVEKAVVATQRRWLAELYASEKMFEALAAMQEGQDNKKKSPFLTSNAVASPTPALSYAETRRRADLLFRNVSVGDLVAEVEKVREWHDALDYRCYREAWLSLGSSV